MSKFCPGRDLWFQGKKGVDTEVVPGQNLLICSPASGGRRPPSSVEILILWCQDGVDTAAEGRFWRFFPVAELALGRPKAAFLDFGPTQFADVDAYICVSRQTLGD
jgi:hypothetical protein